MTETTDPTADVPDDKPVPDVPDVKPTADVPDDAPVGKYRVIGPLPIDGAKTGETFTPSFDAARAESLVASGHIEAA